MRLAALVPLALAAACATRPPPYSERCVDPARPCALVYDFEPSAAAPDVFAKPDRQPQFLVANEDGTLFRWILGAESPWDHDNVKLVRALGESIHKVESAASAMCDGTPVLLLGSNWLPGRKGRDPRRERVLALVGAVDATPRALDHVSAALGTLASREHAELVRLEALALTPDCRTLYVGVRATTTSGVEAPHPAIYPVALDVDWKGTREEATVGDPLPLDVAKTCSGHPEGISALELLPDGSLLVLTSSEVTLAARLKPEDLGRAELAGSAWKRHADGRTDRLACFPGHKPEALAVDPDGRHARVIFEDDDYGGRPIGSWAVRLDLP